MALNKAQEDEALDRATEVEAQWGHPDKMWTNLIGEVQDKAIRNFVDIADRWLKFIWCLDQYRIADAPPVGMGDSSKPYNQRIDGIYRGKGNQFSTLLSLLLRIAPTRESAAVPELRVSHRLIKSISPGPSTRLPP